MAKQIIPMYLQDLESGRYAEVVEWNGQEGFAYFINSENGWANGSRGSITFELSDEDIKMLEDIECATLYTKLKELRISSNGMVNQRSYV